MSTDFGKRLKTARKHAGISQTDLAKAIGISQSSVGHLETIGHGSSHVHQIALTCGVSTQWLSTGDGVMFSHEAREPAAKYENQPSNVESTTTKKQVPLISWVRAGGWGEIDDHNPDTADTIPAHYSNPSKYAFALTVDGDSMTSSIGLSFPHGCNIIVDPERSPQAGDYVVAKDVTSQKATFKKLTTDGVGWYLQALNKDYKTIEIDHLDKRIIGVVIEFYIGSKL
jgi:SOS-response transcriptional repressor LexA